ncbi:hypothetical protein P691DRAFT_680264 [Macrolepiota fuliginosa MF-IS2]|uniref:CCHC-type domain-containing protein n=1 Tax=Macrolepiota fuliginosa MF-IS2 TaxID=1400762 RepID=A0A9P6BZ15_9AGAR|nr:hypothetical protein P691DRAFT_680264 [Macrolepiota fuliginosa MF-IS2]
MHFIAVKKLKNGGTVFELGSKVGAEWIKQSSIQGEFIKNLDTEATIKDRTIQLKVKFVPMYHNKHMEALKRSTITVNGMEDRQVRGVRWLKNLVRWRSGQTVAMLVITLGGVKLMTVEDILRQGILLAGGRYAVEILEPEPWQCAKCQAYGHIVTECKETKDICGNCGGLHQTAECESAEKEEAYRCINCKWVGSNDIKHVVWQRERHIFQRRKERLISNRPEVKYRTPPTNDPDTWRLRDKFDGEKEKRIRRQFEETRKAAEEAGERGRERGKGKEREDMQGKVQEEAAEGS